MPDCVFCKMVKREIPAYIVYEDEDFMAFLDIHPQSPGHVQVVPKKHYRWVWNVPNLGQYFEVVGKIARAQQKAFSNDQVLCRIVGEEAEHAHIWIYPSYKAKGDKMDFEWNAKKIIEKLR